MKFFYWVICVFIGIISPKTIAAKIDNDTSTKGSLLIFPKIDVREGISTYIRIINDHDNSVSVSCYFVDMEQNKVGVVFELTKNQPVLIDAASGQSTLGQLAQFPQNINRLVLRSGPDLIFGTADDFAENVPSSNIGEMKCWAVNGDGSQQISWNHLFGTAMIVDNENGSAAQYRAWAVKAIQSENTPVGTTPGEMHLDGNAGNYGACPRYLLAHLNPQGAVVALNNGKQAGGTDVTYTSNTLNIASCSQDIRQDWDWIISKLDFDIWNGDEIKFSGAWRCTTSVFETELNAAALSTRPLSELPGTNGLLFEVSGIGTNSAYFRVYGNASDQCDGARDSRQTTIAGPNGSQIPAPLNTQKIGLLGTLTSQIQIDAAASQAPASAKVMTSLGGAGSANGIILWDPARPTLNKSAATP